MKLLASFICLLFLAAMPCRLVAQIPLGKFTGCHYNGQKPGADATYAELPTQVYKKYLDEILLKANLDPVNYDLRAANIDNAAAAIIDGRPTILYNPDFFRAIETDARTKWAVFGVLAHEVGHLTTTQFFEETDPAKRRQMEFDADSYSARILRKMCASRDEAQAAIRVFGKPTTDARYPPVQARINRIGAEWDKVDKDLLESKSDPCKIVLTKITPTLQGKIRRNISRNVVAMIDDEKVEISFDVLPTTDYNRVHTRLAILKNTLTPKNYRWKDDPNLPGIRKKLVWYYPQDSIERKQVETSDAYSVVSFVKPPRRTPTWELALWGLLGGGGTGAAIYGLGQMNSGKDQYNNVYARFTNPAASVYSAQSRASVYEEADKKYVRGQVFLYAGAPLAVGGIVLLAVRWNKKRDYLLLSNIEPRMEWEPMVWSETGPAIGIRLRF
ncbi:MAG: hypothetical protein IPH12_13890 [Saprospirales bacterium]|nr:hypothetical protein [Saprospirales bacterium]